MWAEDRAACSHPVWFCCVAHVQVLTAAHSESSPVRSGMFWQRSRMGGHMGGGRGGRPGGSEPWGVEGVQREGPGILGKAAMS